MTDRASTADLLLRSIGDLCDALERAANGALDVDIDPTRVPAAIEPLARTVNRLLQRWRVHDRSDSQYRRMLEEGHTVVYLVDLRTRAVRFMMDEQMEALLGYTREEWQADASLFANRIHPQDRERVLAAKAACIATHQPLTIEYRLLTRHGATLWVHDQSSIVCDEHGQPMRLHGTTTNITARRHVEDAVHDSKQRFEQMDHRLPHVVFRMGSRGLEYVSPACREMLGFEPDELMASPTPGFLILHPEDRPRVWEVVGGLADHPLELQARLVRKDGGLLWAEFHLVPIRDQDGELVATEGVMFDITERKSVESLRRESEELFHTLAAGSPVGIFRTDTHGSCTYVNDYWCALTGIGFGDALGMGWARGLHAADRERVVAQWDGAVAEQTSFRAEYRYQRRDGRIVWVLGQALPEATQRGDLRGYVGAVTDISDRKAAEQALLDSERAKREAARDAADAERRRLARELHDGVLQNLGAIKLTLEVARRRGTADTLGVALERIADVISEVRVVVDDLQPGDLKGGSLSDAIAAHARWMTRQAGIALTLELDPEARIAAPGLRDVYRLGQEALANAVRHGRPSSVAVRLRQCEGHSLLEIEDDGAGFDMATTHAGVGLSSMRERAAALGGDLDITSVPGRGTRIRVTIPSDGAVGTPRADALTAGRARS